MGGHFESIFAILCVKNLTNKDVNQVTDVTDILLFQFWSQVSSVTRFGKISPFWRDVVTLWQFRKGSLAILLY